MELPDRNRVGTAFAIALSLLTCVRIQAQTTPAPSSAQPWEITDNSFLIEEAFNQEASVFQNIFLWTRGPHGRWQAAFTQEWPAPKMAHQLSYTVPFSTTGVANGFNDVQLNYRYQLLSESSRIPAVSPRLTAILPTGNDTEGLGNGHAGVQFNVPASKQFGNFYVHVNAGGTWFRGEDWIPLVGSSVIWQIAPRWNFMFEAIAQPGQTIIWSPGLRHAWNVGGGQLVLGAAVPVTFETAAPASTAFLTYFSFETRFR